MFNKNNFMVYDNNIYIVKIITYLRHYPHLITVVKNEGLFFSRNDTIFVEKLNLVSIL